MSLTSGLLGLGVFGAFGSMMATSQMAAASHRMAAVAERSMDVAEDNYQNVALPTWDRLRNFYDAYDVTYSTHIASFLAQATSLVTYTPQYATEESRAMAGVASRFSRIRQRRLRQVSKYAFGQCCHEALVLDIDEAKATVEMVNRGYRTEMSRKERMDDWYWSRNVAGMAAVESLRAHAITALNRGSAAATAGVSGVGAASSSAVNAYGRQAAVWGEVSSQFASMSNGAFGMLGFQGGFGSVPGIMPAGGGLLGA